MTQHDNMIALDCILSSNTANEENPNLHFFSQQNEHTTINLQLHNIKRGTTVFPEVS